MVADPAKRHILRQLLDGPVELEEIRDVDGTPAALDLEFDADSAQITPAGREALFVSFVLDRWLHAAPKGPLEAGEPGANLAVAALICGWTSTAVHTLAAKPHSFRELNRALPGASRRVLREQLDALEATGMVEAHPGRGAGTRYTVTDWLRFSIAPLAAAARLERNQEGPELPPIDGLDVEAAFLLTLPLLRLPAEISGQARLVVDVERGHPTGVTVGVEGGRVVSCRAGADADTRTWASGPESAWLDAVIEADPSGLVFGGDEQLGAALLGGLYETLYGIPVR